ncbi:hypothetical protein O9929_00905 [Vibrio lentus]|nr:hypothetical protein [Vibrio lentus]
MLITGDINTSPVSRFTLPSYAGEYTRFRSLNAVEHQLVRDDEQLSTKAKWVS